MARLRDALGADVQVVEAAWGTVFRPEQVEAALRRYLAQARRGLPGRHVHDDGAAAR